MGERQSSSQPDDPVVESRAVEVKVLIVGDYPPPHGGLATHVEILQRAVRAAGGECMVLDIGKGRLAADGVLPAGAAASFASRLCLYAAKGFRIHAHTSGANPKSWAVAAACAAAGGLSGEAPLITLHSGLAPQWLAGSPLRARLAGLIGNAFGKVIAVNDEIRTALVTCGVSPSRIEVLPAFSRAFLEPGSPPPGFAELRAVARPLFCAMLAPDPLYGAQTLLAAFASARERCPRAGLVVYGPGTGEPEFRRLVARSCGDAAAAVLACGELHRPAALAAMAGSDVFVRPTLADGDSVSVREALALRRRVIATSVGTRPAQALLVPPGDACALARAMVEVASTVDNRPSIVESRRSRSGFGSAFVEDDVLRRLLVLYGLAAASPTATANPTATASPNPNLTAGEEPRCAASAAS